MSFQLKFVAGMGAGAQQRLGPFTFLFQRKANYQFSCFIQNCSHTNRCIVIVQRLGGAE
jgi:hypothetical protein